MTASEQVTAMIALAGGRIATETRLRMTYYLLDQKGLRSGAYWYYSNSHHGPHSPEFEQGLCEALFLGLAEETIEHQPSDCASYKVFTTTDRDAPATLGAFTSGEARALTSQITVQSAVRLELAASAHWFIVHEQDQDWTATLKRRKGALAENGRLEAAVAFLHTLGLLPPAQ
jgi:hypothetical protein